MRKKIEPPITVEASKALSCIFCGCAICCGKHSTLLSNYYLRATVIPASFWRHLNHLWYFLAPTVAHFSKLNSDQVCKFLMVPKQFHLKIYKDFLKIKKKEVKTQPQKLF